MRKNNDYVFFWDGIYSNWHFSRFEWCSLQFTSAEQAMMWAKAKFFNDEDIAKKIRATSSPKIQKSLGRQVRGFVPEAWDEECVSLVTDILVAKFNQNPSLKEQLIKDGEGRNFVEASPYDIIWGVGLREEDSAIDDPKNWKGKNYLGICLDKARVILGGKK